MSSQFDISFIYNEYGDDLFAYARHLGFDEDTAMDAVHDLFYKLCANSDIYKEKTNLKFYLFRILKNRLIDIHRANREYAGLDASDNETSNGRSFKLEVSVENEFIQEEDKEEIRLEIQQILNNLTDRQREIVYLRYIHEYTYEEIAELMQISVVSCRNLISKAMSKLKDSSLPAGVLLLILKELTF